MLPERGRDAPDGTEGLLVERECDDGRDGDDDGVLVFDDDDEGLEDETCNGCLVDHRAHPPLSPPLMAPTHGVPTPSRPFPLTFPDAEEPEADDEGGALERLHTTSKGSLIPR